jgi:hypothetical protein
MRGWRGWRAPLLAALAAGLALAALGVVATPAHAARAVNDDVSGATTLVPNTAVVGSTDEASPDSAETGESRAGTQHAVRTVWYRYTPSALEEVSFQTLSVGDNSDTVISLYTGDADAKTFAGLVYTGYSNDDGGGPYSYLRILLKAGTTYYLQVDTFNEFVPGGGFAVRLNVLRPPAPPPVNDNLAAASRLVPHLGATLDNRQATTEPSTEPQQPGCVSPIYLSAWYHYTATADRTLRFSTVGAAHTVVNVYAGPTGASAGQLTAVDCNVGAGPEVDASVAVNATSGTEYYVQVASSVAFGSAPLSVLLTLDGSLEKAVVRAGASISAQSLTLAATVAADPDRGSPSVYPLAGSVELVDSDGTSLGSVPVAGSTVGGAVDVTLTVPRPATGDHGYLVLFHSSSVEHTDAFRPLTVSVPKVTSALQLIAPKKIRTKRRTKAKKVTITARVTTVGPAATGQVVFRVGKKTLAATLLNGVATITTKLTKTTKVIATYAGDLNATGSSATAEIEVKTKKRRK